MMNKPHGTAKAFLDEKLKMNAQAEADTLACLLYDPAMLTRVVDILAPDHFFSVKHEEIYKAILKVYQGGHRCTVENVYDELERVGKLEDVGGYSYLMELKSGHTFDPVEEHVYKVLRKATMRKLGYAAQEILQLALSEEEDAAEKALDIVGRVALGNALDTAVTLADATDEYMDDLEQRRQDVKNGIAHGVPTGFTDLDHILGGFQPAHLYSLGALTGEGKSALALNMALNIALSAKHVAFVSLEMSRKEIVQRALSIQAELDQTGMRDGTISDIEMTNIRAHAARLRRCDIKLDDGSYSLTAIRASLKRIHARKKLNLIVIDYLQLIETLETKGQGTRAQEVAEISRSLKRLAQELQVPVLALVQLNRGVEHRQDRKPKLADINESGGIARDSDTVMFIYSTEEELLKREQAQAYRVTINVKKNRGGKAGEANLLFNPRITKFADDEPENLDRWSDAGASFR